MAWERADLSCDMTHICGFPWWRSLCTFKDTSVKAFVANITFIRSYLSMCLFMNFKVTKALNFLPQKYHHGRLFLWMDFCMPLWSLSTVNLTNDTYFSLSTNVQQCFVKSLADKGFCHKFHICALQCAVSYVSWSADIVDILHRIIHTPNGLGRFEWYFIGLDKVTFRLNI